MNKKELSAALKRALNLNRPQVQACLDYPVGWSDGGCFALALALLRLSEGQGQGVGVFRDGEDIMDHAVVRICAPDGQALYLDGDGASDERELLDRWEHDEGIGPCRLEDISEGRLAGAAAADPVVNLQALTSYLSGELRRTEAFGKPPASTIHRIRRTAAPPSP